MAVGFDVIGGGKTQPAVTNITWAHTCGATATHLIVCVSTDSTADGGLTTAVTYNSLTVPSVLRWESGGSTQAVGYAQMFAMASPPTGSALTVSVTVTGGTPAVLSGNSMSFTGSAALGSPANADSVATSVTSGSVSVPTTTSGNLIAVMVTNGSGGTAFTSGTSEWVNTGGAGSGAAGFVSGAYNTSTGSAVATTWTQTSDYYAAIAVEVQATGGPVTVRGGKIRTSQQAVKRASLW